MSTPPALEAVLRDPLAAVAVWRAHGGASAGPVDLRIAEALARRAAEHDGPARQLLARRLVARLATAQGDAAVTATADGPAAPRLADALAALSELTRRLGRVAAAAPRQNPAASTGASLAVARGGAVESLNGTWTRLRVEQRLRAALDQVPLQAGPLNSAQLVSRALQAMRDASPDYLYAFMAHVDGLLALEQAGDVRRR